MEFNHPLESSENQGLKSPEKSMEEPCFTYTYLVAHPTNRK